MDEELLAGIEQVRRRTMQDRSQFIRAAVVEKLQAQGVAIGLDVASAPDRAGKGGRPRKHVPPAPLDVDPLAGLSPESQARVLAAARAGTKMAIAKIKKG